MLAVVIPYFKIDFFKICLDSLVNQTNQNFNVYIGDDASPENPEEILKEYSGKLSFEYKRFKNNLGNKSLVQHWSRCVEMTQGENWIMLLCDDDFIGNNVVETFYENIDFINFHETNLVSFATQVIDEKNRPISKIYRRHKVMNYADFFFDRFVHGGRSSLSEYIFRYDIFKEKGFRDMPLAWHSDDLAWMDFVDFNKIIVFNEAKVLFRLSKKNVSRPNYKLDTKVIATRKFFQIILIESFNKFKKNERKQLLLLIENTWYRHPFNPFRFWNLLILKKIKNSGLIDSIKFSRRVYLNYLRHK